MEFAIEGTVVFTSPTKETLKFDENNLIIDFAYDRNTQEHIPPILAYKILAKATYYRVLDDTGRDLVGRLENGDKVNIVGGCSNVF